MNTSEKDIFIVDINEFQGPFEILWEIIIAKKLDIMNLDISELTNQYLKYIHSQQILKLNIVSEYLWMAAKLTDLKSKWLIAKMNESDEEYIKDSEWLINSLLQKQHYRILSSRLDSRRKFRYKMLSKKCDANFINMAYIIKYRKKYMLDYLLKAINNLNLKKISLNHEASLKIVNTNPNDVLDNIYEYMNNNPNLDTYSYSDFLFNYLKDEKSAYFGLSFEALLELSKIQKIELKQKDWSNLFWSKINIIDNKDEASEND